MVPDEIFDILLPYLGYAELKVLMYLVRRTFGFKKDSDSVSLTQICRGIKKRDGEVLDGGTGLSRPAVIKALKVLENNRIIITHRGLNTRGEKQINTYSLNIIHRVGKLLNYPSKGTLLPTTLQETVLQNNVNDQYPLKPKYEIESLVKTMESNLQDYHSRNFYKKIARECPSIMIYQALSQIRDANHRGEIKKSKAALFTGLIKKLAQDAGIKLSLKK
ncbi:hypothetical protein ES702_02425 [subsurface metagenome]